MNEIHKWKCKQCITTKPCYLQYSSNHKKPIEPKTCAFNKLTECKWEKVIK